MMTGARRLCHNWDGRGKAAAETGPPPLGTRGTRGTRGTLAILATLAAAWHRRGELRRRHGPKLQQALQQDFRTFGVDWKVMIR